jgi:surface carbohydrate biosynthesis protein (TIGR04326 family)
LNLNKKNTVLVWDDEGPAPQVKSNVVLWRGFPNKKVSIISIPNLIEENSETLKARYLAWIHDLGEMNFDGKRVVDHLEIRQDFSYWWMTLIAEKCNFAHSPHITDAIRLMAFEKWFSTQSLSKIILVTGNRQLAECLRLFCVQHELIFEWQCVVKKPNHAPFLKRIFEMLPLFIQGLIRFFQYYIERWPLRGIGVKEWRNSKSKVTFFSYLFNLAPEAIIGNTYKSSYWSNLPDHLKQGGLKTSWLHIYCKSTLLPSPKSAANLIKKLNQKEKSKQLHLTLDSFLTLSLAYRTICDYVRLIFVGKKIEPYVSKVTSGGLILWPLFAKDWAKTFYGANAINNCLYINLFESAMESIPTQKVGVYLYEQQPWELALIRAWNKNLHGRLIAAQHTTMLYWDLRYFHDPRCYKRIGFNVLPMPNKVAVNGPVVQNLMLKFGYPENNLIKVEALRYMYLESSRSKLNIKTRDKNVAIRLLILGDYMPTNTIRQINLLEKALPLLNRDFIVTFKPHPACPIKKIDYPRINMTITDESIVNLLSKCDIAYSSATTSAAVDAYCFGVRVVTLLDPNILNLSPLRGFSDVIFVSTAQDLAKAIKTFRTQIKSRANKNYFFIDLQFPRWRKLLRESILVN